MKPIGGVPGDATAEQMEALADLLDDFGIAEIRVSHEQNLILPHVKKADLPAIFARLTELDLATPNAGLVTDIIACPGLDYCDLANARSIPIAQRISERFADLDAAGGSRRSQDQDLRLHQCLRPSPCRTHRHSGRRQEGRRISTSSSSAVRAREDASIGDIMGPGFGEHEIADAVERVVDEYLKLRADGERFLDTYRRVGMEPFKNVAYLEQLHAAY